MKIEKLNFKRWTSLKRSPGIRSSLIICTYKRAHTLLKLIRHLEILDDLPDEILIIDGSQDDNTYKVASTLLNQMTLPCDIIYVFSPTGLTIQRNVGIDISKGRIIHFLDDDCLPENMYFKEIENFFNLHPNVGGITGNIVNEYTIPLSSKFKFRCLFRLYKRKGIPGKYYGNGSSIPKGVIGPSLKHSYEVDILSGASMSFRREALDLVGGFSEFFSGYSQGEDLEISLRIRRHFDLYVCLNAKCNHYQEPSSRPDLFKKGFMEVYNRHYIWKHQTIISLTLFDKIKFWTDLIFINMFFAFFYFVRTLRTSYLKMFMGYMKGIFMSIFKQRNFVDERTLYFALVHESF